MMLPDLCRKLLMKQQPSWTDWLGYKPTHLSNQQESPELEEILSIELPQQHYAHLALPFHITNHQLTI